MKGRKTGFDELAVERVLLGEALIGEAELEGSMRLTVVWQGRNACLRVFKEGERKPCFEHVLDASLPLAESDVDSLHKRVRTLVELQELIQALNEPVAFELNPELEGVLLWEKKLPDGSCLGVKTFDDKTTWLVASFPAAGGMRTEYFRFKKIFLDPSLCESLMDERLKNAPNIYMALFMLEDLVVLSQDDGINKSAFIN